MPDKSIEFARLKFKGARFENHALPVDVLGELANYWKLVSETASFIQKKRNPLRQRLPKGFMAQFTLVLKAIEDGSAVAVLEREASGNSLGLDSEDVFDRAQRRVRELLAAEEQSAGIEQDELAKALGQDFFRFGASLRDEDQLDILASGQLPLVNYSRSRRDNLIRLFRVPYLEPISIVGVAMGVYVKPLKFRVAVDSAEHEIVGDVSMESLVLSAIENRDNVDLCVEGVATRDYSGSIIRFEARRVEALPSLRGFDKRLEELRLLQPGWLDGEGSAIEPNAFELAAALRRVVDQFGLPIPSLFPTPGGCIQAEWSDADSGLGVSLCMGGSEGLSLIWTQGEQDGDAVQALGPDPYQDIADLLTKSPLLRDAP